jgi:lipopolysaccharide/colanic/teichoic acid biosynthesis glycosyltransferase
MWKRIFDVVVGSLLIIALSPILIALAIYVRLVSKGPSLFCQSRLGEMGEYFTIYKFRTLEIRDEATAEHRDYVANLQNSDAVLEKPDLEDRLIPGGDFLRGHSLDELPQLFNVILGNMTLVGPRPEVLHWDDYEPWQLRRLEATPGMTGLWQVSGKNRLTFNQMVELDIEYIRTRSFFGDIRILLRTFRVVFLKDD